MCVTLRMNTIFLRGYIDNGYGCFWRRESVQYCFTCMSANPNGLLSRSLKSKVFPEMNNFG